MNMFCGGGCNDILWLLILMSCCGCNTGCGGGCFNTNCLCDILPLLLILNCCGCGCGCGGGCK